MFGVTTSQRAIRLMAGGNRTLPWLNIEVELSRISNVRTATAGGPAPGSPRSISTLFVGYAFRRYLLDKAEQSRCKLLLTMND